MIWWYESYIQGSSTASVCTIRCSRIPSQTNPDGLSLTYTHSVQCSKYSLCSKTFIVPEYHRIPTSVWYVRCVRYLVSNGGGGGRRPGVMVGEWSHWSHYIPPLMGYSNHPLDGICQISAWSQACHPVAYCCQLGWSDFCEKNWSLAKLCQIVVGPQFQNFFFKCCFLTHIQAVYSDHSKWGISGALKIKSGIPDWHLQAISESFSQIGQ